MNVFISATIQLVEVKSVMFINKIESSAAYIYRHYRVSSGFR